LGGEKGFAGGAEGVRCGAHSRFLSERLGRVQSAGNAVGETMSGRAQQTWCDTFNLGRLTATKVTPDATACRYFPRLRPPPRLNSVHLVGGGRYRRNPFIPASPNRYILGHSLVWVASKQRQSPTSVDLRQWSLCPPPHHSQERGLIGFGTGYPHSPRQPIVVASLMTGEIPYAFATGDSPLPRFFLSMNAESRSFPEGGVWLDLL